MTTVFDTLSFVFSLYRKASSFLVLCCLHLKVKENPGLTSQIAMVISYTELTISCFRSYIKCMDQTLDKISSYTQTHTKFRLNKPCIKLLMYLSVIPLDYIIKYPIFLALDKLYGCSLELGYLFLAWGLGAFMFLPVLYRNADYHEGLMFANSFSMVVGMYSVKIGYRYLVYIFNL